MNYSRIIAGSMKWGSWGARFDTAAYEAIIKDALQLGITSFDHADIYGDYSTEAEFGAVLQQEPGLRAQLQLITKFGIRKVCAARPAHKIKSYDTSAAHLVGSVEQSLKNLHTDYLDLLLIHRPDVLMHADEIAEAVQQLQTQGKLLHFGVSNFKPAQVELLRSRIPVTVNQVQCSIMHLDPFTDGTLDQCQQWQIKPMAWSPLGGGQIFAGADDERQKRIAAVAQLLAEQYASTPDVILLAWLLQHPANIYPVLGTTRTSRLAAAMKATTIHLQREEWYMLWRASTGKEVA